LTGTKAVVQKGNKKEQDANQRNCETGKRGWNHLKGKKNRGCNRA